MKMTLHRLRLPLAHQFTISRGTMQFQHSLIVELEHDGQTGLGEVTENRFYGHTFASMTASLDTVRPELDRYLHHRPEELWPHMRDQMQGDMFALSALDMAAHDLRGKQLGIPTWQDWQLSWNDLPDSSYTIGIDTIEKMVEKLHEQPGWSRYKIKLGTDRDLEIVRELRRQTSATFRVDANCGWTVEQTVAYSQQLAEWNVEFIEQPLPNSAPRSQKEQVYRNSALPIIADEDCQVPADVAACNGVFHGINVKICKCGGLSPALQMLREAKDSGLKTMVGCMVESDIGISGAAQLLPLLDYADLDGAVLLADTPTSGVSINHGQVVMSSLPGCGGALNADRLRQFELPAESN